jgi:hypothetical protein
MKGNLTVKKTSEYKAIYIKALEELENRKTHIGAGYLGIEKDIDGVKKKKERLGIAFTDGILSESVYKGKLQQLKKQEADLLHRQHLTNNWHPVCLGDQGNKHPQKQDESQFHHPFPESNP